jgi:hypothetical protein
MLAAEVFCVPVEVDNDLLGRDLQILDRRIDDPGVGVMHDQKIDILQGVSRCCNDIFATVDEVAHGPLEDRFAIHLHVLSALGQALGAKVRWIQLRVCNTAKFWPGKSLTGSN